MLERVRPMVRTRTALSWAAALALLIASLIWTALWLAEPSSGAAAAAPRAASTSALDGGATDLDAAEPREREGETTLARNEVLNPSVRESDELPRGELRIQVLDDLGAPAPQARAWIEDEYASRATVLNFAEEHRSDVHELAAGLGLELQLDSEGRAVAPTPRRAVRVGARAPGRAGCTVVSTADTECVVQLAPSHDVSVRFVDLADRPIEGAFVALTLPNRLWTVSEDERTPALVARTDARGLAVLRDVESHAPEYESRWTIEPLLVRAEPRSYHVDPLSPPREPLVFRVSSYGSVRIEVRDRAGGLFAGAGRIALGDRNWSLRSTVRADGGCAPEERLRGGVALFRCVGVLEKLSLQVDPALSLRRVAREAPVLLKHGDSAVAVLELDH